MIKGAGSGVLAELIKPKHASVKVKARFKPDYDDVSVFFPGLTPVPARRQPAARA